MKSVRIVIQERLVERDGWLQAQSRRLEIGDDYEILTPWEDTGARVRIAPEPEPGRRWWRFWK